LRLGNTTQQQQRHPQTRGVRACGGGVGLNRTMSFYDLTKSTTRQRVHGALKKDSLKLATIKMKKKRPRKKDNKSKVQKKT
jgi:hypothetical protein